jgi:hypothetical protein
MEQIRVSKGIMSRKNRIRFEGPVVGRISVQGDFCPAGFVLASHVFGRVS